MNKHKTIYVIGHRNPDTDSIASAIAYAALKQRLGLSECIAAMAGSPNPQTRYILDRLDIPEPLYLADIHPKVKDIVSRQPVTLCKDATVHEALVAFHRSGVRALPVLDPDNTPAGIISLLRLSETFLLADAEHHREVTTSTPALLRTLDATLAAGPAFNSVETLKLFIGAMSEESFIDRISGNNPQHLMIMTGNRSTIQQAAIERGVRLLVITGGHMISEELQRLAEAKQVSVLLTPHDTASAAWLARLSTPVAMLADTAVTTIGVGEPMTHLRQKLQQTSAVLAVEEDGTLAGVATKSSLLAPVPYALILVDHNEIGQAVPGAEAVEILEVIDHHKLGNNHTAAPITFISAPVGSSCTLVAGRYRESGIVPDKKTAGLLLAGILSDTVILKSPTTTDHDRTMTKWLEHCSGISAMEFGEEIFAASSSLKNFGSPQNVVVSDFKVFTHRGFTFGLGQVEVVGFIEFVVMKSELLYELSKIKQLDNLFIAGLMVTDIVSETTLFLVEGHTKISHLMEYPQVEPHLYEMRKVMSRKKQVVPHILKIINRL